MKPARFTYSAPETLDEAIASLAEHGDEGKILAGGQSLVPSMNFRLARPSALIDLNRVPGLDHIVEENGRLRIGALVRHAALEAPVSGDPVGRLLAAAAHKVGHLPIRVRGTFGGSLAHADPAAEWCLLATTLDVDITVTSARGDRTIPAADFFETVFTTTMEPDEILTEVSLPTLGPDARVGFIEFSRRAGDFAVVAVATALEMDGDRISTGRIGLGGVGGTPVRAAAAEDVLAGGTPSAELFAEAAQAASAGIEPMGDIHGSSEYRKDLVGVLVKRALEQTLASD